MLNDFRHLGLASLACILWIAGTAVAFLLFAGSAEASLICPGLPEFVMEETSSSTAPADSTPTVPNEQPQQEHVTVHAFGNAGGSTTGTSSSSSGGAGNASSVAFSSSRTDSMAGLALTGWVASELRFSVPDSPGNDLLRPPQVV